MPSVRELIILLSATLVLGLGSLFYRVWRNRQEAKIRRKQYEKKLVEEFIKPFKILLEKDEYISHSEAQVLIASGEMLYNSLHEHSRKLSVIENECVQMLKHAWHEIKRHNDIFVAREVNRNSDFFDTLVRYPLDIQQRQCCVVDENAGLVIAGAGSGKTSVIMAKVAYLVKIKKVKPEEILLISFTNKAADEMTERIAHCITDGKVEAMTFHKFALEVIKRHQGGGYDIADDDVLLRQIHDFLHADGDVTNEEYEDSLNFFAYYLSPRHDELEYESFGDKIDKEKSLDLNTLRSKVCEHDSNLTFAGEKVKSQEEVMIANFLFLNGIDYRYEMKYPKPYADDGCHRVYKPDFYLPEYDIYIEHYGINKSGEPSAFFSLADKARYKDSMQWKRKLHSEHANKYIETFSWWNSEGMLRERLADSLKNFGVVFKPRGMSDILKRLVDNAQQQADAFEKLITTFITLYKANGFASSYFDELAKLETPLIENTNRQRLFLKIVKRVYERYQKTLLESNSYDFNDLINTATEIVERLPSGALPYRYIIVDEYQDSSVSRMRLLKAAIVNTGAHLFCVGDDWQSIYRFAGSDLSLFTNFGEYFGAYAELKIANTYRNSQELIDIMGSFVMQNPSQVRKNLKSAKHQPHPIVPVGYETEKADFGNAMRKVIEVIAKKVDGGDAKVLLLGRTRYDMRKVAESGLISSKSEHDGFVDPKHPNIKFQFLTVHKAKGLEGDYVILLNAQNDIYGFPNRIADDPILQLVLSKPETYDFAEERRLFYVAITRTHNVTYILMPKKNYSTFIDDLYKCGVMRTGSSANAGDKAKITCPTCKKGLLEKRVGKFGEFLGCSNYPRCDYKIAIPIDERTLRCPKCDGFMVRRKGKNNAPAFLGCSNYPYCRHTMELAPVADKNNDTNFAWSHFTGRMRVVGSNKWYDKRSKR